LYEFFPVDSEINLSEWLKVRGIKNMALKKSPHRVILFFVFLSNNIILKITPPIIISIIINFNHTGNKMVGGQTNNRHLKIHPPKIDSGKRITAPNGIQISEELSINILSAFSP